MEMRERCSNDELNGFLYQYALIQLGIQEDLQKKVETLQNMLEQKDNKLSVLEISNSEMRKQLEVKKHLIKQIKEQSLSKPSASSTLTSLQIK